MNNTTLDAAIEAAEQASKSAMSWPDQALITEVDRTYARALIAKLLEEMEMTGPINEFGYGFNAAITEIKRRAGIEGDEE
jgi:hypothetical protein